MKPISKPPTLSKVFERLVFDYLVEDIKDNIDSQYFRFRPGYSTVHYLVGLLDTILKHFEKNGGYDALFADIVKAFDSLGYNVVEEEAKVMGARPFIVRMPVSFLFKRSRCVQLLDHEASGFLDIFAARHKGLN
ncbi:uncharacterized protein LOC136030591 [Artemia franciscana]|uniref:uncharacterized protein LOC136030591 n=1 Tax=Artemia franciscana TaxID=6661 RepID=UPI0032DAC10A